MTATAILCFGEMLLRYSPADGAGLEQARAFDVHVAGAEANVAISLASLGAQSRMATILPDNALGARAVASLAQHGVDTSDCVRTDGRMGTFYVEAPRSGREGGFFYDRAGSAFALAHGAIAWDHALDGVNWLHLSGITAALGDGPVEAMRYALRIAQERGISISFDCNYRPLLWTGREPLAASLLTEFASAARLVFASAWDETLLGGGVNLFEALPRAEWIASTVREDRGGDASLGAFLKTRTRRLDVACAPITPFVDRIGGGDAFAAGLLFALHEGWDEERAIRFAHRACLMKHGIAGDFSTLSARDVEGAVSAAVGQAGADRA